MLSLAREDLRLIQARSRDGEQKRHSLSGLVQAYLDLGLRME